MRHVSTILELIDAMLMKEFESLGTAIASAWTSLNFDTETFPEIAMDALGRSRTCDLVSGEQILEWAASTPWLPQQANLEFGFGEPPITLFWHPKFYIEALYWTVGSPNVHQHGFSGAFAVLQGSSIQSRYAFTADTRVNAHMLLGALTLRDVKLLRKGDVEPIRAGNDLIHSTFHLNTPSITIVVRTYTDVEHYPQYSYYRPCLAINEFHEDPEAVKRIQILRFLDEVKSPRFDEIAQLAIKNSDLAVGYRILRYLRFRPTGAKDFSRWVDILRQKHGPVVDRLRLVLEESDRAMVIRSRRALITSKDHRFFLALLMSLPSRKSILSLVGEHFRDCDPKETVAQWAFEMSGRDLSGIEFNDLNRQLFRHLMDGVSISDVIRRLESQYTVEEIGEQRERLVKRCTQIRHSVIFRPLLEETACTSVVSSTSAGFH
jgi:hypothetical protein